MKHYAYKNVAKVVKKIGRLGEVKVEPVDDLPFVLQIGMKVFFTPPSLETIRSAKVTGIRETGDGYAVRFAGVSTDSDAFTLEGKLCLVAEEELADLTIEDDPFLLVGLSVFDSKFGSLGDCVDVMVNPAQITLVVENAQRSQVDEILIPFVDEFVIDVSDNAIEVNIPQDLLELNK